MMRFFPWISFSSIACAILFAAPLTVFAAGAFDKVHLANGSILEGCVLEEGERAVHIDTLAGVLSIPLAQVVRVERAAAGASEFLLGARLMERNQFERAGEYLRRSQRYAQWRDRSAQALEQLQARIEEQRERRREEERREIERLIQLRGIQAGIEAIQRMSQDEEDYWGGMRGQLHLAMARERLNHLDLAHAERHLVLADQYGCDPREWEAVRDELVDYRQKRMRFGDDYLANLRRTERPAPPSTSPRRVTNFLAAVRQAHENGERLPPLEWLEVVEESAVENGLDPMLIWAVIEVESSWRPRVVSHMGAQGLMQLMPGTASDMDVTDVFDPIDNIRGGTRYLRFLLTMFGDEDTALAAYNVGPGRVERSGGITQSGQVYINLVRARLAALEERFATYLASG